VPPNRLPHPVSNWLHVRFIDPSLDLVGLRVPIERAREKNIAYWNWFKPVNPAVKGKSAIQRLLASPAVIIGDLNADPHRDPAAGEARRLPKRLGAEHLEHLKEDGWQLPNPEGPWSYISNQGKTSRLDHALISPSVPSAAKELRISI